MKKPNLTENSSSVKMDKSQGFLSGSFSPEDIELNSQALVNVPRRLRRWAWFAFTIFIIFFALLFFVPWTQTVTVQGKLSAYSAIERRQEVHAQINGSLQRWFIHEGDTVKKGDMVLKLGDVDPKFMAPDLLKRLDQSRKALEQKHQTVLENVAILTERLEEMTSLAQAASSSAGAKVSEAENKRLSTEQKKAAAKIAKETALLNLQRSKTLEAQGLVSKRELELAIQTATQAEASLKGMEAELGETQDARIALEHNREKIDAELIQKLLDTKSKRASAMGEVAKVEKELADLALTRSNALQRRIASKIIAPVDGTVVRLTPVGLGEIVHAGDLLFTIVPNESSPAIEMWANAIDAPLLEPSRAVRILFQGVPAIPLPAWPELMAGTYDGRVQVVDKSASANGQFRFWVAPETHRKNWPPQGHVRQGTKVMGWVILNRVPLWYEMWRRFNLFPPDYNSENITLKNIFLSKAGRPGK